MKLDIPQLGGVESTPDSLGDQTNFPAVVNGRGQSRAEMSGALGAVFRVPGGRHGKSLTDYVKSAPPRPTITKK